MRRALDVAQGQRLDQTDHLLLEIGAVAIEQVEQGMDGVEIGPQTGIEMPQARLPISGFSSIRISFSSAWEACSYISQPSVGSSAAQQCIDFRPVMGDSLKNAGAVVAVHPQIAALGDVYGIVARIVLAMRF